MTILFFLVPRPPMSEKEFYDLGSPTLWTWLARYRRRDGLSMAPDKSDGAQARDHCDSFGPARQGRFIATPPSI